MNKWIPKFFHKNLDGGAKSGVVGYFLIEWKPVFSIGILTFKSGSSREVFHNHAFHGLTWWLKGHVTEEKINGTRQDFRPSFTPKLTPRSNFHRVTAHADTLALTLRGPWLDEWNEVRGEETVVLTHGRKVVSKIDPID